MVPVEGRWRFPTGKVTAGLAVSNGSLPSGHDLKMNETRKKELSKSSVNDNLNMQ